MENIELSSGYLADGVEDLNVDSGVDVHMPCNMNETHRS
jgi:hypothetical protein